MAVWVQINDRTVSLLVVQRTGLGDPTPGAGVADYDATLYVTDPEFGAEEVGRWRVVGHDRSTGVWGLVADALDQRPGWPWPDAQRPE